jgi:hypothetical protein
MELNPRIYAILFLLFVGFMFLFGGQLIFHKEPITQNANTTIIYKNITILVTPTVDGHKYFASEYQNGTRLLQHPYSWIRYNAVGKQDMKVTTIIYDYKIFEKLHVFNPASYKYEEILPSNNTKFLFIFAYVFMDDILGDDTRMWMFNRNFFAVYDGDKTYQPVNYAYQVRFKELENTYTFDHSTGVQAFKSFREYSSSGEYVSTAGEYNDEIYYLRGGKSNAVDGYLIYEINKNITPDKLIVLGEFYKFGYSNWVLKT